MNRRTSNKPRWVPVLRRLQRFVLPLSMVFLTYFAWQSRDNLKQILADALPQLLLLSIALWLLCHLLAPLLSILVFRSNDLKLDYRQAFFIHANPLPTRYLPGGIWHSASRFALLHRLGADRPRLIGFFLLENLLAVSVSIGLGSGLLLWFGAKGNIALFATLGLLCCWGALLGLPLLLRRIQRWGIAPISPGRYTLAVCSAILFWLIAASAFASFTLSLGSALAGNSIAEIGGVYLVSWGIGYLSIFTPQGIGVFELVAGSLLQSGLSLQAAIVLIAGFRVVVLMADMLAWMISHLVPGKLGHKLAHNTAHKADSLEGKDID